MPTKTPMVFAERLFSVSKSEVVEKIEKKTLTTIVKEPQNIQLI